MTLSEASAENILSLICQGSRQARFLYEDEKCVAVLPNLLPLHHPHRAVSLAPPRYISSSYLATSLPAWRTWLTTRRSCWATWSGWRGRWPDRWDSPGDIGWSSTLGGREASLSTSYTYMSCCHGGQTDELATGINRDFFILINFFKNSPIFYVSDLCLC